MSEFITTETQYKDKKTLIEALKECGFSTIEEGKDVTLYGYHGDKRPETADIVIRKKYIGRLSNDMGFKFNSKTRCYEIILSEYDRNCHSQKFLQTLPTTYATYAVKQSLLKKGIASSAIKITKKAHNDVQIEVRI